MNIAFCRGCGKEIHASAPSCPQCGAPQQSPSLTGHVPWLAISSAVLAGITFLGSLDINPYDKDEILGLIIFGILSLIFAAITLHQKKPGKNIAIGAFIFAMLGFLIAIGSAN